MPNEPALTDWHTLDAKAIRRFIAYVGAYGVHVERTPALAPTAVYLRRRA
jgi:hypothetical protein